MKLVCLSDTHGLHRAVQVPDGDVLIHAGDSTGRGTYQEIMSFLTWMAEQPHPHKVIVAGNHDFLFETASQVAEFLVLSRCSPHRQYHYLRDSGVKIDGVKFWGSPWTPEFQNWAFGGNGALLESKFSMIPKDTDVLVTHGPAYGIRDALGGTLLGSSTLLKHLRRVSPKVHVFGHIHNGAGREVQEFQPGLLTECLNVAICDEEYRPVNPVQVVDL